MVTKKELLQLTDSELDEIIKLLRISVFKDNLTKEERIALIQFEGDKADAAFKKVVGE